MWEVSVVYYFIFFKLALALFLMAVLFAFLSLFFPYFSKGEYVMDVLALGICHMSVTHKVSVN